jgi:hypothetical protein
MADLLTSIRAELDARMRELQPLLAEYEELLSVIDALDSQGGAPAQAMGAVPRRAPTRTPRPKAPRPKTAPPRSAPPKTASLETARSAGKAVGRGPGRRSSGSTGQAILAALEHGSHTVAELVVVTALPAPDIRRDLRPLLARQAIVKTDRDGKSAYALPA